MGRRNKSSLLEDLTAIAARLPWWMSLLLAAATYGGFHWLAQLPMPSASSGLAPTAHYAMGRSIGMVMQYLVPVALIAGAIISLVKGRRTARLVEDATKRAKAGALMRMSWSEFERLIEELFRSRGYEVAGNERPGADGGVDLVLKRGGERFLVQCKNWRATKVGVDVVRQLFGVMAAQGATGGFVVSAGAFTPDARAFAEGRNIELIGSEQLIPMIGGVQTPSVSAGPRCPKCESPMVQRTAKRGTRAGQQFWGCSRFPACNGARN